MLKLVYKSIMVITMPVILIMTMTPALSADAGNEVKQAGVKQEARSYSDISALEVARMKLKSAVNHYKNGDLHATNEDLEVATEWLNKASQNSKTEKSRQESRQLAASIADFKKELKQSPGEDENTLIRFWHQSTAIIEREIEQLIHGYSELVMSEKILKYLLDARMHLYTAEHDLFVSHDIKDSEQELDTVLASLEQASQVADTHLRIKISALSKQLTLLQEQVRESDKAWINNDEVILLDRAQDALSKAGDKATPEIKLRIESIQADIQKLRTDIERINIKANYESSMETLRDIINEINFE